MKRNFLLSILGIAVALGWWALDARSKARLHEAELAEVRRARDEAAAAAAKAQDELSPIKENVARLTKERDEALKGGGPSPSAGAAKPDDAQASAAPSFEAMVAAGGSKAFATSRGAMIAEAFRKEYAPLLKGWKLSAADLESVVALLPSVEMGMVDYVVSHPEAKSLTHAELKARLEKLKQDARQQLTAVVGAERIGELDNFKAELKVNSWVAPYAQQLDLTGQPLTREQKVKLADALAQPGPEHGWKGAGPVPTDVLVKQHEAQQAMVIRAATGFLSPDQINGLQTVFRENNEKQRAASKLLEEMMKEEDKAAK